MSKSYYKLCTSTLPPSDDVVTLSLLLYSSYDVTTLEIFKGVVMERCIGGSRLCGHPTCPKAMDRGSRKLGNKVYDDDECDWLERLGDEEFYCSMLCCKNGRRLEKELGALAMDSTIDKKQPTDKNAAAAAAAAAAAGGVSSSSSISSSSSSLASVRPHRRPGTLKKVVVPPPPDSSSLSLTAPTPSLSSVQNKNNPVPSSTSIVSSNDVSKLLDETSKALAGLNVSARPPLPPRRPKVPPKTAGVGLVGAAAAAATTSKQQLKGAAATTRPPAPPKSVLKDLVVERPSPSEADAAALASAAAAAAAAGKKGAAASSVLGSGNSSSSSIEGFESNVTLTVVGSKAWKRSQNDGSNKKEPKKTKTSLAGSINDGELGGGDDDDDDDESENESEDNDKNDADDGSDEENKCFNPYGVDPFGDEGDTDTDDDNLRSCMQNGGEEEDDDDDDDDAWTDADDDDDNVETRLNNSASSMSRSAFFRIYDVFQLWCTADAGPVLRLARTSNLLNFTEGQLPPLSSVPDMSAGRCLAVSNQLVGQKLRSVLPALDLARHGASPKALETVLGCVLKTFDFSRPTPKLETDDWRAVAMILADVVLGPMPTTAADEADTTAAAVAAAAAEQEKEAREMHQVLEGIILKAGLKIGEYNQLKRSVLLWCECKDLP